MKLNEFIELFVGDCQISLFEGDRERQICFTKKSWLGIAPYMDRNIMQWEIIRTGSDEAQIRIVLLNKSVESAIDQLKDIAPKKKRSKDAD
jgi:hypothetical protein